MAQAAKLSTPTNPSLTAPQQRDRSSSSTAQLQQTPQAPAAIATAGAAGDTSISLTGMEQIILSLRAQLTLNLDQRDKWLVLSRE